MGRRKGFPSPKPDLGQPLVIEQLDPIATTADRLEQVLAEILHYKLSPRCYGIVKSLAQMQPEIRLAVNIKTVIAQLAAHDVTSVLNEGVTPVELSVLKEVDSSRLSLDARRTVHSLMNIDVRVSVARLLRKVFRDMRTRKNHALTDKPMD